MLAQSLNEAMLSVGFRENIGEIKDQAGNFNHEVKYQFSGNGFNLMLKQNSFSYELIKVENHPDFSESDFFSALIEYQRRDRRYGGIKPVQGVPA